MVCGTVTHCPLCPHIFIFHIAAHSNQKNVVEALASEDTLQPLPGVKRGQKSFKIVKSPHKENACFYSCWQFSSQRYTCTLTRKMHVFYSFFLFSSQGYTFFSICDSPYSQVAFSHFFFWVQFWSLFFVHYFFSGCSSGHYVFFTIFFRVQFWSLFFVHYFFPGTVLVTMFFHYLFPGYSSGHYVFSLVFSGYSSGHFFLQISY